MTNSVNTNIGAIIALQSLNKTNSELENVQKRVSTGFRIADATDDGAGFAVAQGLRSLVKGYDAVGERLSASKGLVTVASAGLQSVSDTLGEARKVLTKLADASLSTAERTQYNADYAALKVEVQNYANQSSFNGVNLLVGVVATNLIYTAAGGTFTVTGQDTLNGATAGLAAVATAAAAATLLAGGFATYETAVGTSLSTVGGYTRSISNQANFTKILADATVTGIGNIVDADLAKESARLQSLQIRQQLGTQSLSIANQGPSALLSLFQ